MAKKLVILGAILAVIVPLGAHIRNVSWADSSLLGSLFPIFGLLAFTLLWLHAISGVFEEWLRERFNFDSFVHWTATTILVSMLLHPLLLLILARFDILAIYFSNPLPISLGIIGLVLLLTYDIGKLLRRKYDVFTRNWRRILVISNIGFILTFFHSIQIGSLVQSGFMRWLWIFYGVTAILAITYTYAIKPFRS
jgi:hypothetical protein